MASKATVLKAELQICDMNRHYYKTHTLTIALHPSETEERMMVRVVAFALHASESLAFTRGLSSDDEPDIWDKDLTDHITTWIDLGQPEEKRIRKACGRADDVFIYTYQPRNSGPWWSKHADALERFSKLSVISIETRSSTALADLCDRNMELQCTIQDNAVYLSTPSKEVELALSFLKEPKSS
ncbi:MAG: YaeQ family protein [Gammaproteobacteria bacterium]